MFIKCPTIFSRSLFRCLLNLLASLIAATPSFLTAQTWDGGGGDNNFGTGANWVGDSSPGVGSGVTLNFAGSTRLSPINNYTLYDDFGSWIFSSGAGSFNISGNPVDLFGKIENNSSNLQTVSISALGANASVEFNPVLGNLDIRISNIYNNGNQLRVYGNNGNTVSFISSVISGTGQFAVLQNSVAYFQSAMTYSGDTFVTAGTLRFGAGGSANSSTIRLGETTGSANAALQVDPGVTLGSGDIVVRAGSSGTKSITTNSSSSSTASISRNIYLDADATFNSQTAGGLLSISSSTLDLKNQTAAFSGPGDITVTAPMSQSTGSGKVVVSGSGNVTFGGSSANTFTGLTTINSGTLILNKSANTNAVAGAITVNSAGTLLTNTANQIGSNFVTVNSGGTFNLNNNSQILALAGAGNVALGSATMTISNGGSDTFSGTISGSGGVTKAGVGTQILSGANSYDGTTTISAGTLEAQHANALGSSANGTTVSSGAVLKLYNATGMTIAGEALNITGAAPGGAFVNTGGNNTWSGAVTLSGNTRINADTTGANGSLTISGNIAGGANALFLGSQGGSPGRTGGDITLSGSVSGAGAALGSHGNTTTSILKDGLGALTLSGSSSFSGATLLNNGTILVGNNNAFGGGLLQVHWQDESSSKTLASTDNSTRTLSNALNIYGNFTLGASDRTGSMVFNGPINLGEDAGNRTVTTANGTSHTFGGNISSGNTAGGPRTLIKAGGGELVLAGTNTGYNATIFVNAGTLSAASNNNLNNGTIQLGSGATTATLAITGGDTVRTQGIAITDSSTAGAISITSGTTYMNGTLSQTAGGNASTKIGKSGAGTLYLGSANSYQGQIQVGQGNVILGNNTASGTNTSTANRGFDLGLNVGDVSQASNVGLYVTNGVTSNASIYVSPNTDNFTRTIGLSGSGSGNFSNEIYMDGNATLTGGTGTVIFSGVLTGNTSASQTGGVIVSGGTVALTNNNTYKAPTAINGGTLRVGHAGALGTSGNISFGGGTLQYGTGITTDFSNRFSSAANQAYAVDTNGNNVTFASALSSSGGSLTKNGTGTLTLNAQNTYNGTTTVNAGTLALGHATNTLADSSSVAVSGGELSLGSNSDTVGSFTLNGTLSGSGSATLTASTYALQGGSVSAALGAGSITVSSGTTTLASGGRLNASSPLAINSGRLNLGGAETVGALSGSGGTLNLGASTLTTNFTGTSTFSGAITGSGGLTKSGSGDLILAGTSGYTGATTVSSGTLRVNGSLDSTAVSVGNAATLGGNATIAGLVTLNSGGTLSPGNSVGTMNFSAGLTLNSTSTVRMEISNVNGSADRINVTGGTLTYAGNLVFDAASMSGITNNTYTLFTGSQTGSWNSVALASGPSPGFTSNGSVWTRNTGDGNIWTYNQSLGTLTVVPEPSTWALIGVGAAFVLWRLRRRKA
jgi:fibronectin-binding autotransporter adhesin